MIDDYGGYELERYDRQLEEDYQELYDYLSRLDAEEEAIDQIQLEEKDG